MQSHRTTQEDIRFVCELCGRAVGFPKSSRGRVEICPHCDEYIDVPLYGDPSLSNENPTTPGGANSGSTANESLAMGSSSRTNGQLWLEVIAVLCLCFLPYFIYALHCYFGGYSANRTSFEREFYLIVESIQISAPLLLIMALTKEPWSQFGIGRPKWMIDTFWGFTIGCLAIMVRRFIWRLFPLSLVALSPTHGYYHEARPEGIALTSIMWLATIADAFSEELAMRAYLISRLEILLRSKGLAVLVSAALFASYHLYQGAYPALGSAVVGIVFGIAFCLLRRLWPLVIAHAFINLLLFG